MAWSSVTDLVQPSRLPSGINSLPIEQSWLSQLSHLRVAYNVQPPIVRLRAFRAYGNIIPARMAASR